MAERDSTIDSSDKRNLKEYILKYSAICVNWEKNEKVSWSIYNSYMKIGRCKRGNGIIHCSSGDYLIERGMYFVILSDFSYTVEVLDKLVIEFMLIDENEVAGMFYPQNRTLFLKIINSYENRIYVFGYLENPQMGLSIRLLIGELNDRRFMYKENAVSILLTLIVHIIRKFMRVEEEPLEKKQMDEFNYILPSIQYIIDHYCETIRISTLAKLCHVSESYYRNAFSEHMNMSPVEYINYYRIEKACELICNSDYSMEVISIKVGFRSITTFYRNFKNLKGCTPFQYRNQHI